MLPLILILILSVFVCYSVKTMVKRGHDIHALAFISLYIYTVFSQIGYAYFPELSASIGAYYGPMLFYEYWLFMFLSFVFTYLVYRKMNPGNYSKYFYIVKKTNQKYMCVIFYIITIILHFILTTYFSNYRHLFGYGGGTPMGSSLFGIGFWIYTICIIILYTLIRGKYNSSIKKLISLIIFIPCIIFFFQVSIASGVRSTLLYFFIAIASYELCPVSQLFRSHKKKLFICCIAGFFLFSALSTLREIRLQGEQITFSTLLPSYEIGEKRFSDLPLSQKILMQDYYNPSHTLFVSMHYGIIDPIEVIKSNAANSLVKLKYPYLTTMIFGHVAGQTEDRGVGWGYYYFVEGFNALGYIGIFYNAIFWNIGMILWTKLSQSNNKIINSGMLAILSLVIMVVMRSQTSAFIQFYWLILLPALALFLLANNSKIVFRSKRTL